MKLVTKILPVVLALIVALLSVASYKFMHHDHLMASEKSQSLQISTFHSIVIRDFMYEDEKEIMKAIGISEPKVYVQLWDCKIDSYNFVGTKDVLLDFNRNFCKDSDFSSKGLKKDYAYNPALYSSIVQRPQLSLRFKDASQQALFFFGDNQGKLNSFISEKIFELPKSVKLKTDETLDAHYSYRFVKEKEFIKLIYDELINLAVQ